MDRFYKESKMSVFGGQTYFSNSSASLSKDDYDFIGDDLSSNGESFKNTFTKEEDAIEWVLKNEAFCFDFDKFSEKLISAIIHEATKQLLKKDEVIPLKDIVEPLVHEILSSVISLTSDFDISPKSSVPQNRSLRSNNHFSEQSIDWPKISEFNIKLGLEKLEDYVATWKRSKDWLFCVEFLGFESEECSNIFVYEVEWSQPTNAYPIPQATASVYFALEVLKMVPYNCDRYIEVTYVFESSNVIHSPGKIDFQEKWLDAIILSKEKAYKSFVFSVSEPFKFLIFKKGSSNFPFAFYVHLHEYSVRKKKFRVLMFRISIAITRLLVTHHVISYRFKGLEQN